MNPFPKTVSKFLKVYLGIGIVCGWFFSGEVWADEVQDLKAEIAMLKQRLQTLERRLSEIAETSQAEARQPSDSKEVVPSWVRNIRLSGFVDVSYLYNTQRPENRTNSLRTFDTEANGFQPHALELVLEKPVSQDAPLGFRSDLLIGEDAEVIGAAGLGSTTDEMDLEQAYVEALLPLGKGLSVKLGKFVTSHGAEVIESKDNWNFSRSILFGFAIPFTHTGLRLSYPLADWLTILFGVNQGWDVVDDNNTAKSIEWQTAFTPNERWFLSVTGMHGPEQANDNRDDRHLIDVVLGYQPTDRLSLRLNWDYAHEEDAVSEGPDENASWYGLAAYARYRFTDWYSVALRGEYFIDADGIRTGVRAGRGVGDLRWWEWTLTHEFKLYKELIARLEYRHDWASEAVFDAGSSSDNTQDTIGLELIYPF
jgi:hypothetical protein